MNDWLIFIAGLIITGLSFFAHNHPEVFIGINKKMIVFLGVVFTIFSAWCVGQMTATDRMKDYINNENQISIINPIAENIKVNSADFFKYGMAAFSGLFVTIIILDGYSRIVIKKNEKKN